MLFDRTLHANRSAAGLRLRRADLLTQLLGSFGVGRLNARELAAGGGIFGGQVGQNGRASRLGHLRQEIGSDRRGAGHSRADARGTDANVDDPPGRSLHGSLAIHFAVDAEHQRLGDPFGDLLFVGLLFGNARSRGPGQGRVLRCSHVSIQKKRENQPISAAGGSDAGKAPMGHFVAEERRSSVVRVRIAIVRLAEFPTIVGDRFQRQDRSHSQAADIHHPGIGRGGIHDLAEEQHAKAAEPQHSTQGHTAHASISRDSDNRWTGAGSTVVSAVSAQIT